MRSKYLIMALVIILIISGQLPAVNAFIGGKPLQPGAFFHGKDGWDHITVIVMANVDAFGGKIFGEYDDVIDAAQGAGTALNDNTAGGWSIWSATTVLPRISGVGMCAAGLISGGYAYSKNYQKALPSLPDYPVIADLKEIVNERQKELGGSSTGGGTCGGPGGGSGPGGDHPDDTTAILGPILESDISTKRLAGGVEYIMYNSIYTIFSGLVNDTHCSRQINMLLDNVKRSNLEYDSHLDLYLTKSYESYLAASKLQDKVLEYSNTLKFPYFRSEEDVNTFLSSLTANQKSEIETLNEEYANNLSEFLLATKLILDDFRKASDMVFLSTGFSEDTSKLINKLGFSNFPVFLDEPFMSDVLVIPSGGLYGLDSSEMFKAKLEKYVLEGGTVIVFSQQHGYEFQALPGGNLTGHGWLEDQSCFAKAVYIDTYHPVLSGQDSVTLDLNVDGYFTSWPENSTILFSRTKNGMPAGIMYKYGNGTVIATTAYTDWAYTHGQKTGDGVALVRDILAWAVANAEDMEIQEYGHGDTVNISVPITNNGNSTVSMVVFNVIDPDKNIVGNVSVPVVIAAGETRTVYAGYAVQSETGIWTVDYELVNESNDTVQVDYDVVRFAVFKKELYSIDNISENIGIRGR